MTASFIKKNQHIKQLPKKALLLLFPAFLIFLLAPPALAVDKVCVRLQWIHQAQFAGYYLAQDLGLYEKAGLEVNFIPGGPEINPLTELKEKRCDFATAWLVEALLQRYRGTPLVHLAQLVQKSALLLVSFRDTGIENIQDLWGKRVGIWQLQFALPPRALFASKEILVHEVPQNITVYPLLSRAVDATTAMLYNEYHQLYQAGIDYDELKIFRFADLGFNFPEDGIYALEETWQKDPDLCRRFVKASLDGWREAQKDPEKALASVMRRVDKTILSSNESHQRWMLKVMLDIVFHRVGAKGLGDLHHRDMALVNQVLMNQQFTYRPISKRQFTRRAHLPPPKTPR
ncbi:ABC transporter substrate-binding protein [Dethiosulfatarculus sandiegensis]|uniref:Thiamine pyrimidine synthase n=1 Tax=Dethiosulfatarculus sandiegensis TaxID=1429043 RepID=A0A0D2K0T6_9BACT|nr:ABC transporter substrate-binding protein [Dethiosulfatarculus sandiegensis]KIX15335.1 ABC transporter substrate-binding protein [Dethiosulfatarculus sandiegensis]